MRSIEQILGDYELTDEQRQAIAKAVHEGYATRNEVNEKRERIQTLTEQVAQLSEQAKALDGTAEEVAQLKQRVAEYEEAEAQRKRAEEERESRAKFRAQFDEALAGRTFANQPTYDAILSKAWERRSANPDMGADAILEAVTAGEEGLWSNPQADPRKMPLPASSTAADTRAFLNKLFSE